MSRRLDGRLARKESRRLDEHLSECASCAKLVATQARQRRSFKGLALIPLPVGLALTGRRLAEATVLRAAHAYQQATDWHERRPSVRA